MFSGEIGGGGGRGGEKSCSLDLSSLSGLKSIHSSLLCSIYQPFFFTLVLICHHYHILSIFCTFLKYSFFVRGYTAPEPSWKSTRMRSMEMIKSLPKKYYIIKLKNSKPSKMKLSSNCKISLFKLRFPKPTRHVQAH